MQSPVGWWTHRREPIHKPNNFDQPLGTPVPVQTKVELAPAPVPYTAWWNVGRDPQHSNITKDLPRQNLAISDYLSVSGWPFLPGMKADPTSLITPYQPKGFFNPQSTRSNIVSPPQTSLGMLSAVEAPILYNDNYAKLV